MAETWKGIAGWEDKYSVSDEGRVMSHPNVSNHSNRVLIPHPNEKGYLMVHLYRKPVKKTVKVHRLVAEAFVPNPMGLPEVNHKDRNRQNNRADNLEWVSRKGNMSHARKMGGMDSTIEKLAQAREMQKVPVIAREKATGEERYYDSVHSAAAACGTTASLVSRCLRGERKSTNGFTFRKGGME